MFALWQIYQWSFETKNPIHIETKTCSCCRSRQSNCSSFDLLESILNKVQRLLKQNKTSQLASRRPNLFFNFQNVSALLSLTKKPEFFFLKLCVLDTDIGADMPELLIFRKKAACKAFLLETINIRYYSRFWKMLRELMETETWQEQGDMTVSSWDKKCKKVKWIHGAFITVWCFVKSPCQILTLRGIA